MKKLERISISSLIFTILAYLRNNVLADVVDISTEKYGTNEPYKNYIYEPSFYIAIIVSIILIISISVLILVLIYRANKKDKDIHIEPKGE